MRKQIPEPVFSIIKSVLGIRQFLWRDFDNVHGDWNFVTEWLPPSQREAMGTSKNLLSRCGHDEIEGACAS